MAKKDAKARPVSTRPRFRFIGTGIALVVAATLLVIDRLHQPASPLMANGRIAYEAGADGKLRRVAEPSTTSRATAPLWKPEVGLLIVHAGELHLAPSQVARLQRLDRDWQRLKAGMLGQMRRETPAAPRAGSATMASIRADLSAYAGHSRAYDAEREDAWQQGLALLDRGQRDFVERVLRPRGPAR